MGSWDTAFIVGIMMTLSSWTQLLVSFLFLFFFSKVGGSDGSLGTDIIHRLVHKLRRSERKMHSVGKRFEVIFALINQPTPETSAFVFPVHHTNMLRKLTSLKTMVHVLYEHYFFIRHNIECMLHYSKPGAAYQVLFACHSFGCTCGLFT